MVEIIVVIVGLYLWLSGNYIVVATDIMAEINKDNPSENPYIQMVMSVQPDSSVQSYGAAFSGSFGFNRWSYFKQDGVRYVEVVSKMEAADNEQLRTIFSVTSEDNWENVWVEIEDMYLDDSHLSEEEMSIVLAGIFKDDLGNMFADYLIDNMFNY